MYSSQDQKIIVQGEGDALPNAGVSTQVANPRRASRRTFFQSLIGNLAALNALLGGLQVFLAEPVFGQAMPPILYVYINGAVIIGAGAAKLLTLVMAMPAVDEWIGEKVAILAPIGRVPAGQVQEARISGKRRATRVDD